MNPRCETTTEGVASRRRVTRRREKCVPIGERFRGQAFSTLYIFTCSWQVHVPGGRSWASLNTVTPSTDLISSFKYPETVLSIGQRNRKRGFFRWWKIALVRTQDALVGIFQRFESPFTNYITREIRWNFISIVAHFSEVRTTNLTEITKVPN